jgi:hypothetical protein
MFIGVYILYKPHELSRLFLFIFTLRGALMGEKCDWPCWEIMGCEESKKCPAKNRPETPCWEIAREMSDYRYILQICVDCIVHMLKGDKTVLSKHEIQSIMVSKANCVLTSEDCIVNF